MKKYIRLILQIDILILKEDFFKPEYRDEKFQIVLAMSGFGCDPQKMGNAIYVKELCENPESYRIERCDNHILGIAKDSVVKQHLEKYS